MSRYEPWTDHDLAILYGHLRFRRAGQLLAPYMPGRTHREINEKIWRIRREAKIRVLPTALSTGPPTGTASKRRRPRLTDRNDLSD